MQVVSSWLTELHVISMKLPLMILNTWICIMRRCKPNASMRGMYDYIRGILKHKISLNLIKIETYLPLFKLTQLKKILKDTKNYSIYSTQKHSRVRYSTHRLETQLQRFDTRPNKAHNNSR